MRARAAYSADQFSTMKPRRSRRVEPLKDSDYDHEINLLDHSSPALRKPSTEAEGPRTSTSGPSVEGEPSPLERRSRTPEPVTAAADHLNGSPSSRDNGHTQEHAVPALEVEGKYYPQEHKLLPKLNTQQDQHHSTKPSPSPNPSEPRNPATALPNQQSTSSTRTSEAPSSAAYPSSRPKPWGTSTRRPGRTLPTSPAQRTSPPPNHPIRAGSGHGLSGRLTTTRTSTRKGGSTLSPSTSGSRGTGRSGGTHLLEGERGYGRGLRRIPGMCRKTRVC